MKNKKIIIGVSIMCVVVISITLILITNKSSSKVLDSNLNNTDTKVPGMFAIMLETEVGTGKYEQSTSGLWPGSGYEFNSTLSQCENGGTLIWNEENRTVNLKSNLSDRCYLYFDIVPPDVTIYTNNNGNYNPSTPATLSCTGAEAEYNPLYQRIEISSIANKYTSCNLTYQTPSSKTYLNNYIIGLSGSTQGTGQVVQENGYRYEGKDPNNYIWFNNELWRIIGVFDSASHGVSGQNLVKIIRNNSIGEFEWTISDTNDWSTSSLMNLLNGPYYNAQDGVDGAYCYGFVGAPVNCNFETTGITDSYRAMVQNVTWYLGGHSTYRATADAFYGYERSHTVYNGNPTNIERYIGLIYPSDYGYSALSSSCSRTVTLGAYQGPSCAGQSWMYTGSGWTITPTSTSNSSAVYIYSNGQISIMGIEGKYLIKPTLYLNSSVYVIDGNGSKSNPYIIGM